MFIIILSITSKSLTVNMDTIYIFALLVTVAFGKWDANAITNLVTNILWYIVIISIYTLI